MWKTGKGGNEKMTYKTIPRKCLCGVWIKGGLGVASHRRGKKHKERIEAIAYPKKEAR